MTSTHAFALGLQCNRTALFEAPKDTTLANLFLLLALLLVLGAYIGTVVHRQASTVYELVLSVTDEDDETDRGDPSLQAA